MATNDEKVSSNLFKHGCIIRIALLGHPNVGCNTLLSQFTNSSLEDRASWRQREVTIDGINVRILLFHWKNLETRLSSITLKKLSNVSSCAKAIVGNKSDFLSSHTTPVVTEGKEIARKNSIPFFFMNAATGENTEHVIVSIAAEALIAVNNKTLPSLYLAPTHSKSENKQKGDDTVA